MEALNYSTHAIESLQSSAINFMLDAPKTAQNILRVVELLKQSVKFLLPDNGELFEDGLRALPAIFRLPYPIIAAEFKMTTEGPGQGALAMRGEKLDKSTKRIALAVEINADNFDAYTWMLSQRKYDVLTSDGAIAIIPVFYADAKQCWVIPPIGIVIPSRKIDGNTSLMEKTIDIYDGTLPQGVKVLPLELHTTDLMPEFASDLEAKHGLAACRT